MPLDPQTSLRLLMRTIARVKMARYKQTQSSAPMQQIPVTDGEGEAMEPTDGR